MDIDVRVMLRDDQNEVFMGIGVVWLLRSIETHKSINQAARDMGLSYPKALRMIRNLEEGLDQPAVTRHRGGNLRGGAELTPMARDFLERYEQVQSNIKRFAARQFQEHLDHLFSEGRVERGAGAGTADAAERPPVRRRGGPRARGPMRKTPNASAPKPSSRRG